MNPISDEKKVNLKVKKRPLVIHPILFALFPVVFLLSHNVTQVALRDTVKPILVIICASSLLWLMLSLAIKNTRKAAILVSSLLLLFFSYGHLRDALTEPHWWDEEVLLVNVIVLAAVSYAAVRSRSDLRRLTAVLNIVAVFLVAIPASTAAYGIVVGRRISMERQVSTSIPNKPQRCPDIYYIILDGYARADVLKDVYEYDNAEFLDYLAQKGFYVATKSRANYSQTHLSLASSLNLTYLDDVAGQIGTRSANTRPLVSMIQNSRVIDFLRRYGYVFIAFSSGSSGTEIPDADVYLTPPKSLTEFTNVLINTTPIPLLQRKLLRRSRIDDRPTPEWQYDLHRRRLLYIFDHLAAMTDMRSPIFVFAHILAPHPPFVFGPHGEPIQPNRNFSLADGSNFMIGGSRDEYVANYRSQLTFINQKTRQTIDKIISNSPESIIILQADHGPRSMLDWEKPDNTNLKETMSILNAYYLPNNGQKKLYDKITPVNTFRIILNHYFGMNYELLTDESYFSTWYHPYEFIRVAGKIGDD